MTKVTDPQTVPRTLVLIVLLIVGPAIFETAIIWRFFHDQNELTEVLVITGVYGLVAIGLLAGVRLARLITIFWACSIGVVTLIGSILPILQMFPLRYFTIEAAILNGAALLYVCGLFSAAIWLNGHAGKTWFSVAGKGHPRSPNKGFNRTPESSGPAKPGEPSGGAG